MMLNILVIASSNVLFLKWLSKKWEYLRVYFYESNSTRSLENLIQSNSQVPNSLKHNQENII